ADNTITFQDASGTVAYTSDIPAGASLWESSAFGTYEDDDDVIVGTSGDETIANAGFVLGGDDLFVAGMAGVEGNIYTDSALIAGSNTTYAQNSLTQATGTAYNINLGGAAGDDLIVDTNTLVVESDNNRVGIGTTAPNAILQTMQTSAGSHVTALQLTNTATTNNTGAQIDFNLSGDNTYIAAAIGAERLDNEGDGELYFMTREDPGSSNTERMRIDRFGNIGIGVTDPLARMEIQVNNTDNDIGLLLDMDDTTNNPNVLVINNAGTGHSLLVDEGSVRFDDAVKLGSAADDVLTASGTWAGGSPFIFEGATANDYESTFAFTDPTADRTITFQNASGTVAYTSDIPAGASLWEVGANGTYEDDAATIVGPDVAETLSNASFTLAGNNDLFVGDSLGVEGNIYTDGSLIIGSNAQFTTSGVDLIGMPLRMDSNWPIYFDTANAKSLLWDSVDARFEFNDAVQVGGALNVTGATTLDGAVTLGDAAADILTASGTWAGGSPFIFEGATADGFESTFTFTDPTADNTITFQNASGTVAYTSDIPAGASLWEVGANGTYEDDAATIVGPDAAETLSNAGFTLAGNNDLFVGDKFGVEGSIYTDSAINVDKAEDTAFVTLNDTTNVDNVSIYTGTGSPNGALAAQAGSLFMDQTGSTYVNTDGATAWTDLIAGSGANTALSNLVAVAINTTLLSDTTNTDNLGSDTFNWANLFLGGNIIFEGATDNGFETTVTVTDPTADRTITIQDGSGTLAFTGDTSAGYLLDTGDTGTGDYNFTGAVFLGGSPLVFEGATANAAETTFLITDPTADRTITFKDGTGTVAFISDIPTGASLWESGAFATYEDDDDVVVGTSGDETIDNPGFSLTGDDFFVIGMAGVEGNVYTDSSFIAGNGLMLNDSYIRDTNGDILLEPDNDNDDYIRLSTGTEVNTEVVPAMYYKGILGYTNDPGISVDDSGKLVYRDENSASWVTIDSLSGTGMWEDGTNGIYENDKAVIVGDDIAETLNNTGFTLTTDDMFVVDELGVEGSIFTDSTFYVDKAEDTAFITLSDTTNTDTVSIYTGTGTPSGLSAQAGSLFLDQSGSLYVNTDNGSTWANATSSGGWTDDGTVVRLVTATDQVGLGTASPLAGSKFNVAIDDANNNTVTNVAVIDHTTSGVVGNGIGSGLLFRNEDSAGQTENTARISGILTNTTSSSETSAITFRTRNAGTSLAETARFSGGEGLLVGGTSETMANPGFSMSSDDVYVAGLMGIEGNVYTDGSFIAGSSLELNDTYIRDTNDDIFLQPDNDPNNYIRLSTGAAEAGGAETVSAMYYEGILSYTNDPGLSINDAGQLVYRDEDSASWVTLDSLSGTGLWEDGTNGVYEDDEAVIVGSDVAETLSNTGFTLAASDMFIADQLGVEGSIFTDNTFNVDKAEDTAFITLNDVTNIDTVSIYTGTGSPNGALAAQAGSLFMDQAGATYVNTDGGTAWSDLAAVPSTSGWTDGGTDVNLTTSTDNIGIGGASLGKLSVDGDTDEIQFLVQGNATQTSNLAVFENSAGTDLVTISGTGVTALTDGTVGAPILTFAGDSNTGMYRVGSDSIGFSAGGVQTLRVGTSGIVTGFLATTDGTAGVPGHSFTNDPDTGMYRSTTNTLGFAGNGANMFTLAPTSATITQAAATSGSPTAFTLTGGAHTTLAASTEDIGANLNFAATKQFATGALATQREVLIQAPTYGFVGASTITDAATLAISGAPIAGTNATITNPMALWVQGGEAQFDGVLTTAGASALNGAVTLGDAAADILTANGTWAGASPLVFEGATANDFETTFTVTDPTADNTITFKNETGTVAFLSDIGGASGWTDGGAVVYNTTAGDAVVIGAAVDQDAKLAVIGDNSAEKGLRVVGASGQSDELFLIEANGGTDIYRLNAYGSLYHKPTTDVSGLEIDGGNVGSKNLIRLKSYNDIDDTDPGILNIEHEKSSSLTGDVTGAHVDMITTQANSAYNIIGFETVMNPADTTKTIGLRIQDAVTDIQLADTAATVAIGNTGTLTFTDGTNTLAAIKDQGDYGFLNIDPKSDTGDPATCAVGDIYVNSFDGTIKACTATNTWEALDGGGSVTSLDTAYDGGQSITVDASGDLVFNLTSTQDFVVQDAGTPRFTVTDTGLVDMTPGSTSNAIGLDIDIAEASTGAGAFTMLNIDGINGANTSSDYDALKIKIGSVSESSTVHPEGLVITNGPTAGSWDTDVENYIRLVKDGSGALGAPSVSNFILIDGGAATDTGLNLGATDIVGTTADINFTNFDVTGSSGNVVSAGTITSGTNTNVLAATGGSETVFNEQQANIDFRVEGDLQNYMLHVDADLGNAANAGRLGIGTNARSDAFAYVGPSYTMNSSTNNAGTFKIAPNTVTNSFGSTVDEYASLWIAAPTTFTQSGTLTNAATIYVQDAPAAATNNYAMLVDAGDVVFDGNAIIGGSTSRTETLSGAFTLGGDDLFVAGTLGVEGAIYTDATATKYQSLDINGAVTTAVTTGSKIGGLLPVQELDADGDSRLLWSFLVPDDWVSGTDILATLFWSPSNTDTGNVAWDVDYASIPDGDTVTAGDFTDVSTTEAAGGTTDQVQTQTFTVANAGIAADEMVVLSVNRDGASGSDTFTGNAHLSGVRIEYTGKKLQ
ncbi:hypothetical protein KJ657_02215, partial [Patescibacteria group bacterium]|nr:hypothetical protein [Patescibacteria group bacterium]MBU1015882.1 hypothetical protein [Patescibacteria group bacterium]MBU1685051.1 hypothetical protein [Patescibacteria group bacterium]MBU1938186.1 hypothetical protein [Patescibacteria group bacterium]